MPLKLVKAIAKKIGLEGNIEGNKPEEKITRMQAAIATAPAEMHPIMNSILAHWYWHYFQQNRWRFMQRTATAEAPGSDFTTWDLPRIFAEVDKHFTAAEVKQLLQFYGSPVGQKFATEMPKLTQEAQTAGMALSQQAGREAWQELRQQNPELAQAQRVDRRRQKQQ